jgi:glycosyltransferase involved in cell wall biosynthesis
MRDVILDCDLMRHRNSGLYYYCQSLGDALAEIGNHSGVNVKYYVPPAEKNAFKVRRNVIVERKFHRFLNPFLWNCRVWHAPFQSGRVFPDSRRYPNVKIVLTVHDLNALHEGKTLEEQRNSLARTQSLIDRSDAIVCISEFAKQDVLLNCKTDGKPVYVIHNGTNVLQEPSLHAASYQPMRPFLFGMGYVNRKKNYHVVLSLLKNNPELEFILAGRHDEQDYIDNMFAQAGEWGIADRIRLTGPVTENEKAWYLANCYAFVHPSLAEGFGAPVTEAMNYGKPIFLSNLTSLPEVGGDVSFYFSSFESDHMTEVFREGMQRYQSNGMSEAIKARAKFFDWKKSAAAYLKVYESFF